MEYLVNAREMKQYDADTIEKIGIPSLVLMERASLAVMEEMIESSLPLSSVLVVCGSGNNGGDGFAVARLLGERGIAAEVLFVGREASMSPECRIQRQICENCGIKISSNFPDGEYTTIVDAIFGTGLSRQVEGRYAELIRRINAEPARKVAVDIPSGISADTGEVLGAAVRADLTVTFAFRKVGQVLYPGAGYCGRLVRRSIGITMEASGQKPRLFSCGPEDLERVPERGAYSNKGTYGKVLLIAGSEGMSGAACLCARAALRTGCGLARVFTPQCNRPILQTCLPEAIVTAYEGEEDAASALPRLLEWADVVGIGPGIGTGKVSRAILDDVLRRWQGPLVIDADGLNLLAGIPDWQSPGPRTILTPHVGEMLRLTKAPREELLRDLVSHARDFARERGVICVLKDARTVISDGQRSAVNTSGNDGLAKGGSGDVLTGVLCGLLAQGMEPFEAAYTGAYLHGLAGDLAARHYGNYGMLAGETADAVGEVLRSLQISREESKTGGGQNTAAAAAVKIPRRAEEKKEG